MLNKEEKELLIGVVKRLITQLPNCLETMVGSFPSCELKKLPEYRDLVMAAERYANVVENIMYKRARLKTPEEKIFKKLSRIDSQSVKLLTYLDKDEKNINESSRLKFRKQIQKTYNLYLEAKQAGINEDALYKLRNAIGNEKTLLRMYFHDVITLKF
jgi:hypothetical protein